MAIILRAMQITRLKATLTEDEICGVLEALQTRTNRQIMQKAA